MDETSRFMAAMSLQDEESSIPIPTVLTRPPKGYHWQRVPVDSGCTTVLRNNTVGLSDQSPTIRKIVTANGVTLPGKCEGTFHFMVKDDKGKLHHFGAENALYTPHVSNLMGTAMFEEKGHMIVLAQKLSSLLIKQKDGTMARVPIRPDGRLRMLDILVPDTVADHTTPEYAMTAVTTTHAQPRALTSTTRTYLRRPRSPR